jgi:hypothetical protein
MGNKVYVAGFDDTNGKVWKDGTAEPGYTEAHCLNSLFIDGSDVYAAGITTYYDAAVWKNGVLKYTFPSPDGTFGEICSILIHDGNVYSAGFEYNSGVGVGVGKVWKNNETLYTLEDYTQINSIYIYNGDIYAAVISDPPAGLTGQLLINGGKAYGGTTIDLSVTGIYNEVVSVVVANGEVYVAGMDNNSASYWRNGEVITLPSASLYSSASCIFVPPLEEYAITVTSDENGTASADLATAPEGTLITLAATPNEGYKFAAWQVINGGAEIDTLTKAEATFTMPANAVEIKAIFEEGVGIVETQCIASLRVYPNPTTGELTVWGMRCEVGGIEVFDIFGKQIVIPNGAQRNEESQTINIASLSAGIYFLKIQTEQGAMVHKIIKN